MLDHDGPCVLDVIVPCSAPAEELDARGACSAGQQNAQHYTNITSHLDFL